MDALKIRSFTWNSSSKTLFNYHSKRLKCRDHDTNSVHLFINDKDIENNERAIMSIEKSPRIMKPLQALWLVIKNKYRLSEGDLLQIGNKNLLVKKISFLKNQISGDSLQASEVNEKGVGKLSENAVHAQISSDSCRICMQSSEHSNPVINICSCYSGMHIGCLRTWLGTKLTFKEKSQSKTFKIKKYTCEICKYPYPDLVYIRQKPHSLMPLVLTEKDFVVIEELSASDKILHVINFQNSSEILVGSSNQSEIRLYDRTVSNVHARISVDKQGVYITDNMSKYGTTVKIERSIEINAPFSVQSGNRLIKFYKESAKRKRKECMTLFSCIIGNHNILSTPK